MRGEVPNAALLLQRFRLARKRLAASTPTSEWDLDLSLFSPTQAGDQLTLL